jgi:glycyl-tRNA synthetase beta chain
MSRTPFLLEIGTEEIPARFLPGAQEDIKRIARDVLHDNRLGGFDEILSYATPRRIAVYVDNLDKEQSDLGSNIVGPPKSVAYDEEGNITKAGVGFARKQGVAPESLQIVRTDKGEYVEAVIEKKGRAAGEVLPEILREIVLSLSFPKSMRWGGGNLRFARPIHWILSLYGTEAVQFDIEGIKSGNRTEGHRFLSPGRYEVKSPSEYLGVLDKAGVMADPERRRQEIELQAKELANGVGGVPVYDEGLLSTLTYLVEYPQAVLCSFGQEYLVLPDELLTAVMVGHQKYIPLRGADGKLINHFVVISNTRVENEDTVRTGAERVVRARFEDARFYYEKDIKKRLDGRLEDLRGVTFHRKLGTLYDKTERVRAIARSISDHKDFSTMEPLAGRAAELSKCDLVSGVVFEFPELQGVMGKYYALNDGEREEVARAIEEHYLPAFSGDRVPTGDVGAIVALADRIYNLISFFDKGIRPTGSEDPFALRRQALGVISILIEKQYDFSIRVLLDMALVPEAKTVYKKDTPDELLEFFKQRFEHLMRERGYAYDVVQAVLGLSTEVPLKDILKRLEALKGFKSNPEYETTLIAMKRVRNIIPDEELPNVAFRFFSELEENNLNSALDKLEGTINGYIKKHDFASAINEIISLSAPINSFFDHVLVMDKDDSVRMNRLALLNQAWAVVSNLADFSKLQETTENTAEQ